MKVFWVGKRLAFGSAITTWGNVKKLKAFLQPKTHEALQILVDSRKHVVLPIIWSGVHHRAERMAKGDGPQVLWRALPILFVICLNLFRCVPRARGPWIFGVFFLASSSTLLLCGFIISVMYLMIKIPWWLGAPFYKLWYQPLMALGAYILVGFIVRRFSVIFDFLGDVASYIAQKDI
jgi:hypothetical protein